MPFHYGSDYCPKDPKILWRFGSNPPLTIKGMKVPQLGNIGQEGCPCGEFVCDDYKIEAHCWRSVCDDCEFSGVHYDNEAGKQHAQEIADYIQEAYHTEVKLVPHLRDDSF